LRHSATFPDVEISHLPGLRLRCATLDAFEGGGPPIDAGLRRRQTGTLSGRPRQLAAEVTQAS
jgi:hypothetical protein